MLRGNYQFVAKQKDSIGFRTLPLMMEWYFDRAVEIALALQPGVKEVEKHRLQSIKRCMRDEKEWFSEDNGLFADCRRCGGNIVLVKRNLRVETEQQKMNNLVRTLLDSSDSESEKEEVEEEMTTVGQRVRLRRQRKREQSKTLELPMVTIKTEEVTDLEVDPIFESFLGPHNFPLDADEIDLKDEQI